MSIVKSILVDVPNIDSTPMCLKTVGELAAQQAAKVTLMTVLPSFRDLFSIFDSDEMRDELQGDLERQAASALKTLTADIPPGCVHCTTVVAKGARTRRLIARVLKEDHDLLVKDANTEIRDSESLFGPIDHKLVRHCPCPVWLLRDVDLSRKEGQIVVAIDAIIEDPIHLELNQRLVKMARMIARTFDLELHLLHVSNFDQNGWLRGSIDHAKYAGFKRSAKRAAIEKMERFADRISLNMDEATTHILEGVPGRAIVRYCAQNPVATVVIGSVGRSGLSGFLIGNTAEQIMNRIETSLLVISPTQVKSPIEVKLREDLSTMDEFSAAAC